MADRLRPQLDQSGYYTHKGCSRGVRPDKPIHPNESIVYKTGGDDYPGATGNKGNSRRNSPDLPVPALGVQFRETQRKFKAPPPRKSAQPAEFAPSTGSNYR